MSEWSNNNLAHRYTWYISKRLGLHRLDFAKAKTLKLKQLDYFLASAGPSEQKQRAKAFASLFANLLQDIGEAKPENHTTHAKAINTLAKTLMDGEQNLMQLAHTVDELYFFKGEK